MVSPWTDESTTEETKETIKILSGIAELLTTNPYTSVWVLNIKPRIIIGRCLNLFSLFTLDGPHTHIAGFAMIEKLADLYPAVVAKLARP